MPGYRFQIASSVGYRDGLALELIDERGEQVLEVFRDDDRDGTLTFNSYGTISVPFDIVIDFVERAKAEFAS